MAETCLICGGEIVYLDPASVPESERRVAAERVTMAVTEGLGIMPGVALNEQGYWSFVGAHYPCSTLTKARRLVASTSGYRMLEDGDWRSDD